MIYSHDATEEGKVSESKFQQAVAGVVVVGGRAGAGGNADCRVQVWVFTVPPECSPPPSLWKYREGWDLSEYWAPSRMELDSSHSFLGGFWEVDAFHLSILQMRK